MHGFSLRAVLRVTNVVTFADRGSFEHAQIKPTYRWPTARLTFMPPPTKWHSVVIGRTFGFAPFRERLNQHSFSHLTLFITRSIRVVPRDISAFFSFFFIPS